MTMVYQFKKAAHFKAGFDRGAAALRLASILERDGYLDTEAIIEDGTNPSSPLFPQFDISPDEAQQQAWERAAEYLRIQFVVIEVTGDTAREVRAVFPVFTRESPDERRYIPTFDALGDDDYRQQVLDQALRDLISLRRKYADLKELARIFAAIDKTAAAREVELKKAA